MDYQNFNQTQFSASDPEELYPDPSLVQEYTDGSVEEIDEEPEKKSHAAAWVIGTVCVALAIGGLGFGGCYALNQRKQNSSSDKKKVSNTTQAFKQNQVYELGDKVRLDISAFANTGQTSVNLQDYQLTSDLMTNSQYSYNQQTREVTTKGKDYLDIGTYTVVLTNTKTKEKQTISFTVKDTVAPKFAGFAESVSIEQNAQNVQLESYWAATDVSEVKISVTGDVDLTKEGEYKVRVFARDKSGNETHKDAVVKVIRNEAVLDGEKLTKTKDGEIPISTATEEALKNPDKAKEEKDKTDINRSDDNDKKIEEEIKRRQEEYMQELEYNRQLAMVQQSINGWRNNQYMEEGQPATGFREIEGEQYYFDNTGQMQTGWQNFNGGMYYYLEDGRMAVGSHTIGGQTYFFDLNGLMHTGWRTDSTGTYYYDEYGVKHFGAMMIDGKEYYLDPQTGARYSGFRIKDGKTYYYLEDGTKAVGDITVDDAVYHFDEYTGALQTGVVTFSSEPGNDGATHTILTDESGKRLYGLLDVEGRMCFFDPADNGYMKTGRQTVDGKVLYFNPKDGGQLTGWIVEEDGTRYFDPENNGAMATGKTQISVDGQSYWYYFDENGVHQTGHITIEEETGKHNYYFDPEHNGQAAINRFAPNPSGDGEWFFDLLGIQQVGLVSNTIDEYYCDPATGNKKVNFQIEIDGQMYSFNSDGVRIRTGFFTKDGVERFYEEGIIVDSARFVDFEGHTYFIQADGIALKNNVVDYNGSTYALDGNGWKIGAKGTYNLSGIDYHVDADGRLSTGFYAYGPNGNSAYVTQDNHKLLRANESYNDGRYDIRVASDGTMHKVVGNLQYINQKTAAANMGYSSAIGDAWCAPTNSALCFHFVANQQINLSHPDEIQSMAEALQFDLLGKGGTYESDMLAGLQAKASAAGNVSVEQVKFGTNTVANFEQVREVLRSGGVLIFSTKNLPWLTYDAAESKNMRHILSITGYELIDGVEKVQIMDTYTTNSHTWYASTAVDHTMKVWGEESIILPNMKIASQDLIALKPIFN